ncbi:histidine ammonia-lyase [Acidithrix ferrooxidans]|uniref:Histidine ammonia-lyase n=1 Tax=Acidithrix ferrooxidans TaxID=1280514 RepID=A0A0D8HM59_9ACTN|nr:histidine ammonia-lyase [Acidithrix ferrooxidans]KJF18832.1 histidine ammonia-lyase [Acidithrix ferrooxidans]
MIEIHPGNLSLAQLRRINLSHEEISLDTSALPKIAKAADAIGTIAAKGEPAYGVNTGFGRLATTHIDYDRLELLQENLVLSHAVGVGLPMEDPVVRLVMVLKIASLARGHSGIRFEVIDALIKLYNAGVMPIIPSKGSVGASGDLAPLAHMATILIGVGEVRIDGVRTSALVGLNRAGLKPLKLAPKEGLALLNGTQASTAFALHGLFSIETLFATATVAGSLAVDAAAGSTVPFDDRIHQLRGHIGQIEVAKKYRELLSGSEINFSHQDCAKVQDPYSLRCQPQVMGAIFDQIIHASKIIEIEANSVSDNPLVFPDTLEVLSGGNFHAEPIAFAADNLAIAASEIGALAERRIALLIDSSLSGLPPFLVREGGVNSGFMIAHVTAASLASENKSLAHPASVDSLPTSANQEDHVSMATFAARRLSEIANNVAVILGIEILVATQGIDLRAPHKTSNALAKVTEIVRRKVAHYEIDHYLAPDIDVARQMVEEGVIANSYPGWTTTSGLDLP